MGPRILTFTSLFPNARQPMHGLFVRERIRALAAACPLEVVAPVPWAPPLPGLGARYAAYRQIADIERDHGLTIHHPRFFVVPKVMKTLDGLFMGASCLPRVARIRQAFPFDLIDAHWAYPDGAAAAYIAARLRVPFAVTVRGDDINIFAAERGRGAVIRWMLRRAALVIALSEDLKARVEQITDGQARSWPSATGSTRIASARWIPRRRGAASGSRRARASVSRSGACTRRRAFTSSSTRWPSCPGSFMTCTCS
jgi:hypothetical protein